MKTDLDNYDLALQLAALGWQVFPCNPDKTPATAHGWHDATANLDKINSWWSKSPAAVIGLACAPSGLWVLDLDRHAGSPDGVAAFTDLVNQYGGQPVEVGPTQTTPGNGCHLVFKAPRLPAGFKMPGKLAPGIDIRYDGYICTGALPDGRRYQWQPEHEFYSDLVYPPAWIGRLVLALCKPKPAPRRPINPHGSGQLSPGDDFASRTDWGEILPPGWVRTGQKGEVEYWRRPGKREGVSAIVNYGEHENLYIFSTNASPFEPGKSYSKFAVYAMLKHGGDFAAAARALAAAGYGSQKGR